MRKQIYFYVPMFFILLFPILFLNTSSLIDEMCTNGYYNQLTRECSSTCSFISNGQCFDNNACSCDHKNGSGTFLQEYDEIYQYTENCTNYTTDFIRKDDKNTNQVCALSDVCKNFEFGTSECICGQNYEVDRGQCLAKGYDELNLQSLQSVEAYTFYTRRYHQKYIRVETGSKATIDLTNNNFDVNIYIERNKCLNKMSQESCLFMANVCLLSMYSETICSKLLDDDNNNKIYDPNITKKFLDDFTDQKKEDLVKFEVSFDKESENVDIHELDFRLAKWDKNGKFVGIDKLKNELNLCTSSYEDNNDYSKFGATYQSLCDINLQSLNKSEPYFYELYLYDKINNEYVNISVPVMVYNYKEGDQYNGEKAFGDRKYFRRFFTFFNYYTDQGYKSLIAQTIQLKVRLQNKSTKHLIYMPWLEIIYNSVDIYDETSNATVLFRSDYFMDMKNVVKGFKIIFWIVFAFVIIMVFCRMYVWRILNPPELSKENYEFYFLLNFFMKLFKFYGSFIFFYSWGVTAYLYIFFKLQYRPYVMMWNYDNKYEDFDKKFNIIWGLGCSCFVFYMFFRIYQQCNFEIFFVDWEHEKDLMISNANTASEKGVKKYRGAWRNIHVANQFNILQRERTISIPFCFCWLIMLWYYKKTRWDYYAQTVPNVTWIDKSPENILLRHFVVTFVLFVSGLVQYIARRLIQYFYPMRKVEFLDLCSVSNISVLILQDSLRGYYIHGQSPLGTADTTLSQLIKFLEEERKGKIKGRGLTEDESEDLQSYEIYMSYNMRTIYDGLYDIETKNLISTAIESSKTENQSRFINIFKYIPSGLQIKNIWTLNKFMNLYLKNKISQVASQSKAYIKEKTQCERFFEYPPSTSLVSIDAKEFYFYKDPRMHFDDVLFTGMELEWLIMIIYIFEMWIISLERYGGAFAIGIFMTFVMEKIFYKIRVYFGEKNVATKAVIDNRFL